MPLLSNAISGGSSGAADPIVLAATTSAVGQVQQPAGTQLLHTYGSTAVGEKNLFLGESSGNFTNSGALYNIGIGYLALAALTNGDSNTAVGNRAGQSVSTATNAVLLGYQAGQQLTTGGSNTLVGAYAGLNQVKVGTANTILGNYAGAAGSSTSDFSYSVMVGSNAGGSLAGKSNYAVSIGYLASSNSNADNYIAVGYNAFRNGIGDGSVAIGYEALDATTAGAAQNTCIGYRAGTALTTAIGVTCLGYSAGMALTTTSNSGVTVIGSLAANVANNIQFSTVIGERALYNRAQGQGSVAIGQSAAANNGSGTANGFDSSVAIGKQAGSVSTDSTTIGGSVFVGSYSGYNAGNGLNGTLADCVAIGYGAFYRGIGDGSIAIGAYALDATTTGAAGNTVIGYQAATAVTTATNNTIVGYQSGTTLTTSSGNTILGQGILTGSVSTGVTNNVVIGRLAAGNFNGGTENVIAGANAGSASFAGGGSLSRCVLLGYNAGYSTSTTLTLTDAVAIGYEAGRLAASNGAVVLGCRAGNGIQGTGSIAIGYEALDANTAGAAYNIAIGYQAGTAVTTGTGNTLLGYQAGLALTTVLNNIAIGKYALKTKSSSGSGCIAIGVQALEMCSTGYSNTVIGGAAFLADNTGYSNTGVGSNVGILVTTGQHNSFLGDSAGSDCDTSSSRCTVLGSLAQGRELSEAGGTTAVRLGITALGYRARATSDYVAVFGAENGAGNANGELNGIGVGTTAPTLFWQSDDMSGMTTDLGGYAIKLINKTGLNSVKGTLVSAGTAVDDSCILTPQGGLDTIGVMWSDGVADGSPVWVVVSGIAQVKMGAAATRGQFVRQSITGDTGAAAGTAVAEAAPTTPFATDNHFREVGHCIQSIGAAGLARCVIHFN